MEAMSAEQFTWTLGPAEYFATRERAAKINERAAKRGFTGRVEVTGTKREVTETDALGLSRTRVVYDVVIAGEAPKYSGWTFLAAVDAVAAGYVLRVAPGVGETDIDRETLVAGRCEHCNTVRGNRKYTYLVRNEDGRTLQVGSTCIRDFLGWEGRPVFISEDDVERELGGGFGGDPAYYTPETVVAVAWAASRKFGWVSASSYDQRPTKAVVDAYLYGASRADRELQSELAEAVVGATEKAAEVVKALLTGLEGSSDYVQNLKTLLKGSYVEPKHLGIVASAVSAYEKMVGKAVERKAREQRVSEWAGAVGDKLTFTGVVARLTPVESDWGTSMLVVVEDATHTFKMFTGAQWAWDVEQGQTVTVKGTVKKHDEYHGTKQTEILRPKQVA